MGMPPRMYWYLETLYSNPIGSAAERKDVQPAFVDAAEVEQYHDPEIEVLLGQS